MGNHGGLGLHFIFVSIILGVTTYTCLGDRNTSVVCSEQERVALFKFKHSVKDGFGMLSSWTSSDCCQWEGIHCDSVTGTVESLLIRGDYYWGEGDGVGEGYNYLIGKEVTSSLAELRHLKYLDLSGNYFLGSRIPEFIGSFEQLAYLDLSRAGFQGIIPHHIGNLSNLKVLDLSSNEDLIADDWVWTSGLLSLEHLDLSSLYQANNWDMVLYMIPSLNFLRLSQCGLSNADLGPSLNSSSTLPNIKHLDLGHNFFKGPLPDFFQNMTSVEFVDLSFFYPILSWKFENFLNMMPSLSELHLVECGLDNTFLTPMHFNFSRLYNIRHLALGGNSIEGIFPSILTNMSSLRVLDLSQNLLNSLVPVVPNLLNLDLSFNEFKQIEHVGIWRQCHLKHLSASGNNFDIGLMGSPKNESECPQYDLERLDLYRSIYGTIPESLGTLANLRSIDLSSSELIGPIPVSLGRLMFLEVLDLSNNQLCGPIITFLGKLSRLDLSVNQLNGSIPESLGNLAALTDLNLGSNQLTCPIPASIGRLVSLQTCMVSSNSLNGTIPVAVGQLAKLHFLDISNNSLEGVVSEAHFANLLMLKHLITSFNMKLIFNISREWIPPFQLVTFKIQSCNIANEFPRWLRNQMKLRKLVLSNATISGPLPTWLRQVPIIPFLDLSHNKLSGSLTNLPSGGNFDVFGYYLARALFLEDNLFNESIPRSLCRRTDLEYLDLSRNRLTGNIPECLGNMQNLHTMIFGSNQLRGVIPSSIGLKCFSLFWLQLNDNYFIGELPQELVNLRYLNVLDLGDNAFSGNIPEWFGEMPNVVVLRLRKNNFTGRIPQSLSETSLQILDVSYNSLTGTIPHSLGGLISINREGSLSRIQVNYDESVIQFMKGVNLEYRKILDMVFNIDLSSNKLVGEIPVELTSLIMLVGLNLSNNHLRGGIPDNIGNMKKLESLDLSRNELTGRIPPSLRDLNFLSHLNLSKNNLSGRILTGSQLQTLTDPSIYAGNKDLCGPPLPKNCSNHEDPTTPKKNEADDETTKVWLFYVDIMCGFATGFWGFIGVLLFKKLWRQKLFMFVEETMDKIYVMVVVRIAMMKRGREAT